MTRLHELTFNAPLLAELRALKLAERLITEGGLPRGTAPGQYRRIRLHRIVMDAGAFDDRSKLHNDYDFFDRLRQHGQAAAQQFLDAHFARHRPEKHDRSAGRAWRPSGSVANRTRRRRISL